MLAIPCVLSELKPPPMGKGQTENLWSEAGTQWLKERVLNKEFVGQIYSVVHNVIRVQLYDATPDPSDESRFSINEIMIQNGFACKAEEFFLSKQNHELRAIFSSEIHTKKGKSANSLSSALSTCSLNITSGGNPYSVSKMNPRRIRGPCSPLEMRFVALSRNGCSKGVTIDPNSVNSTALDLEPQSLHDRLIVAPFVVLNPSESTVVLRSSTVMPSLPGMLSLSLLIFSPFAELRVDESGSEYTGALFGLGCDDETKEAIYPDDDMEVVFDFKFSQEDLSKINRLRYLMSSVLQYNTDITPADLARQQKVMREILLEIMNNKRPYSYPGFFNRAYKWNQVPEKKILYPETESNAETSESFVWPLLHGIASCPENKANAMVSKVQRLRWLCKRLMDEKEGNSYAVAEFCPLCEVQMKTFEDLKIHLSEEMHNRKEHHLFFES